ncbi:unnamed protein product [Larinioides sclopetarius]|uniref:Uncharacterized protein n=1 Tax=Larinioides sclopetarius TaxID=280406 RepID=A0AAV2A147_9ARAC
MASPQKEFDNPASFRRQRAISIKVRFFRSATPFCDGEYGTVNW